MAIKLDKFIFTKSTFVFAFFFLLVLIAFWPGYFSRLLSNMDFHFHAHGIIMTIWCVMLIIQPYLIRKKRKDIHRIVGKTSYVLMPLIVFTALSLMHFRLQGAGQPGIGQFYFMALVINALVILLIIYGLAIYNRKNQLVHARYMICTVFPMLTPVTDRLIYIHMRPLVDFAPVIDGITMVPVLGFILADITLLVLAVWDWRSNKRIDVFPIVLGLLLLYHISVMTFHNIPLWQSFGKWFLRLNLS